MLARFRDAYNPRIAVTVDMIATGTDVRPLECLLFMRDVKSRNYFDHMKGRGTRTLDHNGLAKVSRSAGGAKTHFVIVDAVGVTESLKTETRSLKRKPSVPLKGLLYGVLMGERTPDTLGSLANRLARLGRDLTQEEHARIEQAAGRPLAKITRDLFQATDQDRIEAEARRRFDIAPQDEPSPEQAQQAAAELARDAAGVLIGPVNELVEGIRRERG